MLTAGTVVVDGQALQSGSRLGGIGRYTEQLIRAIATEAPGLDLVVLLNDKLTDGLEAASEKVAAMPSNCRSVLVSYPDFHNYCDVADDPRRGIAEVCKYAAVESLKPHLYLNCSVIEGYVERVVGDGYLLSQESSWCRIAILYDVIPLANPELYLQDEGVRQHYLHQLGLLQRFDHLLSISQHSKDEFAQMLGYPQDRITNIAGGIDHEDRADRAFLNSNAHLKVQGLQRDFLLFVGSFDIRKNQEGLIRGFARLPSHVRRKYQLVIVGNGWPEVYEKLREVGREEGLCGDELIFAGKVSDEILRGLYEHCALFVFPSFFEGLGLPVLEAMRAGALAVCSNTSCMPEIMGDERFVFDPYDADVIAHAMERGLEDPAYRNDLAAHCSTRWRGFTWQASAQATLDALGKYELGVNEASQREAPERALDALAPQMAWIASASASAEIRYDASLAMAKNIGAVSRASGIGGQRVGVVSSWRQRCGIATYAENLMCKWEPDSYEVFAPLATSDELLPNQMKGVSRCWTAGTEDGLALLRDHILCSGVSQVLIHFNYGFFGMASLGALLETLARHQIRASIVFHSTVDPVEWNPDQRLSRIKQALARCAALYVHGKSDVVRLKALGLINVVHLHHGIDISPDALEHGRQHVATEREPGKFRIGAFGYCLPHKGFTTLVEAFVKARSQQSNLELVLLTSEYPADSSREEIDRVRQLAAASGLAKDIRLETRFLDMTELTDELSQCDLVVFPYQNTSESSSAAVRTALSAIVPVAVTPLEIFDDVSESTIRLTGCEADVIAQDILDCRLRLLDVPNERLKERERVLGFLEKTAFFVVSNWLHNVMLPQETPK